MPRLRRVGLSLATLIWSAPAAVAQESIRPLEQAAARYREVQAICADFEQVIAIRPLRRSIESAGRVCQRRPNLFSMRFTDPLGDMVVSDGDHFWVYYPSAVEDQVMRHPVSDSPGREDFFREFLDDPGAKYEAETGGIEAVDGRDCRVVSLTPLTPTGYRAARLWLDVESHVIRRLEIHEENKVRTVTLRDVDLAPEIQPGTFVFEVPRGARVMGPRGPGAHPGSPSTDPRGHREVPGPALARRDGR